MTGLLLAKLCHLEAAGLNPGWVKPFVKKIKKISAYPNFL